MNILIVEDEAITALFLSEVAASLSHHVVATVDNADDALKIAQDRTIDLALMDIEIKGRLDGIQTATMLKEKYDIPSLFITSYKDSTTIKDAKFVAPLGYLIKPIVGEDIEAALMVAENQIKHGLDGGEEKVYKIGAYEFVTKTKTLTKNGKPVSLTQKETKCLQYMLENIDTNISSEQLIMTIWDGKEKELSSLRELVFRLRKKLPDLKIKSVSKFGYILLSK